MENLCCAPAGQPVGREERNAKPPVWHGKAAIVTFNAPINHVNLHLWSYTSEIADQRWAGLDRAPNEAVHASSQDSPRNQYIRSHSVDDETLLL